MTTPPKYPATAALPDGAIGRIPATIGAPGAGGVALVGCANVDVLVRGVAELPPPGTDKHVEEVSARAAGPVLNTGFVIHALGDGPAHCFGAVGGDPLGRLVLEECSVHGVPTGGLTVLAEHRTGVSVAVEARHRERVFLTDIGASGHFDEALAPDSFAGCTDVLLGGYFVVPALRGEPTARLARQGRTDGARVWLDCGWDSDSWATGAVEEVLTLLPEIDLFVPNVDEVAALTGGADPIAGGRELAKRTRRGVIVKGGADGAWWMPRDGQVVHAPAPHVEVVDTTGAGDALNAGVMVGLRRGLDMAGALRLGVDAASAIVARSTSERWDPLAL